jgi:hypothetical protein
VRHEVAYLRSVLIRDSFIRRALHRGQGCQGILMEKTPYVNE